MARGRRSGRQTRGRQVDVDGAEGRFSVRAILMEGFGGPDVLHMADVPVPKPGHKEILVQVAYAGVNPIDWKIREGHLQKALPHEFPITPGWEMSGIVTATGDEVTLFKPNDRVYAFCRKP